MNLLAYVIAGFSAISLGLGASTWYYKEQYNSVVRFKEEAEEKVRQQEEYVKILNLQREDEKKLTDEKHELEITALTDSIERMRKQTSSSSLLPKTSSIAKSPEEITFTRKELDSAIQYYREEVQRLVGIGTECQIDLKTAQEWAQKQDNEE